MSDGIKLSANLYLPVGEQPFPAIMTYIPYLKDGGGGLGSMHAYQAHFASRGYAVIQLDMRGVGSSEGENKLPWNLQERADAHEAIEWIADQPWCNGNVGMWGLSYGGITAISTATTHPPHLKAIIPVHATDDNWDTLFEHRGSRLMLYADPHWGPKMAADNLLPPLRPESTPDWIDLWHKRLEANTPWHLTWHGESPTPDYWEEVKSDPGLIEVPVFVICGWQDAYPEDTVRIYNAAKGPKRLLFGPWKHTLPDESPVAPVDFVNEMDLWWDRWLKGEDNGIDKEPPITIYVQGKNEWRVENEWPLARQVVRTMYPSSGRTLVNKPSRSEDRTDTYDFDARAGIASAAYDAVLQPIEYPADQSSDDVISLSYTADPLSESLEVTGQPEATVYLATELPLEELNVVAKLLEVTPSGTSHLVSHENLGGSRCTKVAEIDGTPVYLARFLLRPTSYQFAAGNQIRLAISGSDFPFIWPTPRPYQFQLLTGDKYPTGISLPTIPETTESRPSPTVRTLDEARDYQGAKGERGAEYSVTRHLTNPSVTFNGKRWSRVSIDQNLSYANSQQFSLSVDKDFPDRANTWEKAVVTLKRANSQVEIRVDSIVTLRAISMKVQIDLDGIRFWERSWFKTW